MTDMNVLGHLGFELYAAGAVRHAFGKWHNTATDHNQHHRKPRGNFFRALLNARGTGNTSAQTTPTISTRSTEQPAAFTNRRARDLRVTDPERTSGGSPNGDRPAVAESLAAG